MAGVTSLDAHTVIQAGVRINGVATFAARHLVPLYCQQDWTSKPQGAVKSTDLSDWRSEKKRSAIIAQVRPAGSFAVAAAEAGCAQLP
jgi:hypothetical protein